MLRLNLLRITISGSTRQIRQDLDRHVVLMEALAHIINSFNAKTDLYVTIDQFTDDEGTLRKKFTGVHHGPLADLMIANLDAHRQEAL